MTWGAYDFVAAEITATRLLVGAGRIGDRRDPIHTAPIGTVWIADPAQPSKPPRDMALPVRRPNNAEVSVHLVGLDGQVIDVEWDRASFPYVTEVHWSAVGWSSPPRSRSQQDVQVLDVEVVSGATTGRFADHENRWVELVAGLPRLWTGGELVNCADR